MAKVRATVLKFDEKYEMARFLTDLPAQLETCRFTPCAAGAESSMGFVPPLDADDLFLSSGPVEFFRIQVETRKVSDKILYAMAKKRIDKIEEASGRTLPLNDALQITAQVKAELWELTAPSYTTYWVALIRSQNRVVYFAPPARSDDISALFRRTFGSWVVTVPWEAIGFNAAVGSFIGGKSLDEYGLTLVDTLHIGKGKETAAYQGCDDFQVPAIAKMWQRLPSMAVVGVFFPTTHQYTDVSLHGSFTFKPEDFGDEELHEQYGAVATVIVNTDIVSRACDAVTRMALDFVPAGTFKEAVK